MNMVIALRVWDRLWQHGSISVRCDNLGVVQVVKTSKPKNSFLALCVRNGILRNLWLLAASFDIELHIDHIPGCKNMIADTLSRVYSDNLVNPKKLADIELNYVWDRVPARYFDLNTHL